MIQLFIENCHQLQHVDVSGCRLLTDHAFFPLIDALDDSLMKMTLKRLNVSGLDSLSPSLIHQLLNKISSLQELCLGVTYSLDEADQILQDINNSGSNNHFYIDTAKFYTICRLPSNQIHSVSEDKRRRFILYQQQQQQNMQDGTDNLTVLLPSSSTWNIPPPP